MNINFSTSGSVSFDMIPYITKVIADFPEKITGVASSPAADHLFKICPPNEAVFSGNPRPLPFTTPLPNFFSSLVSAGTFKQRLLSSPLKLKLRMKTTGANSSAYSITCS
jgi:hypothetical protein